MEHKKHMMPEEHEKNHGKGKKMPPKNMPPKGMKKAKKGK